MAEVSFESYSDAGAVQAETVISLPDREFILVQYQGDDEHRVFERDPGSTQPKHELTEDGPMEIPDN